MNSCLNATMICVHGLLNWLYDGNVKGLRLGIEKIRANAQVYKEAVENMRGNLLWEAQIPTLAKIASAYSNQGGRR